MGESLVLMVTLQLVVVTCDDYYDETTLEPWLRRSTAPPRPWSSDRGHSGLLEQTARTWIRQVPPGTRLVDARPSGEPYTWLPEHRRANNTAAYPHSDYEDEAVTYKKTSSRKTKNENVKDDNSDYEDETVRSRKTRSRKKKADKMKNETASDEPYKGQPQQRRDSSTAVYTQSDYEVESSMSTETKTRKSKIEKTKDETATPRKTRKKRKKSEKMKDHHSEDDRSDYEHEMATSRITRTRKNKTGTTEDEMASDEPYTGQPQQRWASSTAAYTQLDNTVESSRSNKTKTREKEIEKTKDDQLNYVDETVTLKKTRTRKKKCKKIKHYHSDDDGSDYKNEMATSRKTRTRKKKTDKIKSAILTGESHTLLPQNSDTEIEMATPEAVIAVAPRKTMTRKQKSDKTKENSRIKTNRRKAKVDIQEDKNGRTADEKEHDMKGDKSKSKAKLKTTNKSIISDEESTTLSSRKIENRTATALQSKQIRRKTKTKDKVEKIASDASTNISINKSRVKEIVKSETASQKKIDTMYVTNESIHMLNPPQLQIRKTRRKSQLQSVVDPNLPTDGESSKRPRTRIKYRNQTETDIDDVRSNVAKTKRKINLKLMLQRSNHTLTNKEKLLEKAIPSETSFDTYDSLDNDTLAKITAQGKVLSKLESEGKIKVHKRPDWMPKEPSRRIALSDTEIKSRLMPKAAEKKGRYRKGGDKLDVSSEWDDGFSKVIPWDNKPSKIISKSSAKRGENREDESLDADRSVKRGGSTRNEDESPKLSQRKYKNVVKRQKPDPNIAFKAYNERERKRQPRGRNAELSYNRESGREYQPQDYRAGESRYYRGRGEDIRSREDDMRKTYKTRSQYSEATYGTGRDDRRDDHSDRRDDGDSRRNTYRPRSRTDDTGYPQRDPDSRRGKAASRSWDNSERRADAGRRGPSSGTYDRRSYSRRDSGPRGAPSGAKRAYSKKDLDDKRARNKRKAEKRKLKLKNRLKIKKAKGGKFKG